jgi:glutamine amidotransferase
MGASIEVLDLGVNNLASLVRGFRNVSDAEIRIVSTADEGRGADLMVLPGVGAFGAAAMELRVRGLDEHVRDHVASGGPLFGVCLGMQLLTDASDESPGVAGLGFIPGRTMKLQASPQARVPNMGWTGVTATPNASDFPSLSRGSDYYFVHSFAVEPVDHGDVLVHSEFDGRPFVSGLIRDNVIGVQFHPEKSSFGGQRLLAEIVEWGLG